jgi:hypothetical protein
MKRSKALGQHIRHNLFLTETGDHLFKMITRFLFTIYAAGAALRVIGLRSLTRVPPTTSYCEESSP